MPRTPSSDDDLRASLEARRHLGPEYEDSLVEGFLEKMDQEIDKRVDDRLAQARGESPGVRPSLDAGQRLALSIISLGLGVPGTVAVSYTGLSESVLMFILALMWVGIIGVNVTFAAARRRRG
ncbi:hypothetical protein [Streptosporangium sp. NPDC049078]|uniref:hypothetical protein n=1 Tax=Streptosporangium sp. NPDC049078 TaxID=3155767 RepID=UPI003414F299